MTTVTNTNDVVQEVTSAMKLSLGPGATVSRRPWACASSARLEEIEIVGRDASRVRLVAKHVGRAALTEAAQLAKPGALHCVARERDVYRDLLAYANLGTPDLVAGWVDPEHDAGVIVLERVQGTRLSEVGDFATWERVAQWLARMHARFTPQSLGVRTLVDYQESLLDGAGRRGVERAAAEGLGSPETCVALGARHAYAVRALACAPMTLVHGDFHPSNIVVAGNRIAVVDWELAGRGAAALDLAALASGGWSDEQRLALLRAYHEESLKFRRVETFTALVRRVELAALHHALQWIGAAPEWEPPEEHRRDRFADAVATLRRLEQGPS